MGIYIFKSKHMDAFKIGHYGSGRKVLSNPWSRVSKRGFYSCKCPESIENNVSVHDLDLICWYQNGCVKDELFFHKKFSRERIVGEWFNDNVLDECILFMNNFFDSDGEISASMCSKEEAIYSYLRL